MRSPGAAWSSGEDCPTEASRILGPDAGHQVPPTIGPVCPRGSIIFRTTALGSGGFTGGGGVRPRAYYACLWRAKTSRILRAGASPPDWNLISTKGAASPKTNPPPASPMGRPRRPSLLMGPIAIAPPGGPPKRVRAPLPRAHPPLGAFRRTRIYQILAASRIPPMRQRISGTRYICT